MRLTLTLALLATPVMAAEDHPSDVALAAQAEAAFAEGVRLRGDAAKAQAYFRKAAGVMEQMRQRGVNNPLLHRNLGNAYLLANDLPHAILTYRQGLRLVPGDRGLSGSLSEARELVVYPESSSLGRQGGDDRPPWLPRLQPVWCFAGAIFCYLAAWFALTRWLMARRPLMAVLALLSFLGAAVLAVVVYEEARREQVEEARPLVVIADDGVLLRKGNSLSFPPRWQTPVNKGVEARLLFERGDFVQVQLAGGEIGWVPRNLVVVERR